MHIPEGFAQVFPYIFARHPEALIDFLVRALGGIEIGRTVAEDGGVANCRVGFGHAAVMVSQASQKFPPSRAAMYLYVESADATMERAVQHGARKVMDVENMPYGDRQGGILDTEGNIWWLSERLTADAYDQA